MPTALVNYLAPNRYYHNLTHIHHMLEGLTSNLYFGVKYGTDPILRHAILYHDAIYDPFSKINELQSADAAVDELRGWLSEADLLEVHRLIMLTKGHQTALTDHRGAVMIDLDLAGLAGSNYWYNAENVRKEYGAITDEQWRIGRIAFLETYLGHDYIFHTDVGRSFWEIKARNNMEQELAKHLDASR